MLLSDAAIYVGVRAYDSDPDAIVARLARRDQIQQSDAITIYFDSFHDRRTSFQFAVTPRGSIQDAYSANDRLLGDASWDPVWQVATSIDEMGWVHGLTDLPSPARLELRPYLVAQGRRRPESTGNIYAPASAVGGKVGFDLKYGLSSDFTLDLAVNPDFGQVEADPAVVNLTAFESFFPERRPFFVEGGALFNRQVVGARMFYSRRIGRRPQGWSSPPDGGTIEIPDASTIVSAAKVTGKSAGGLGLGLLSAVTAGKRGTMRDASGDVIGSELVQPWVHHFAGRVEQDYGDGRHTVGTMATALNRFDGADDLGLRRAAYAMQADGTHKWQRNTYSLQWIVAGSHIRGTEAVILAARGRTAAHEETLDGVNMSGDGARSPTGGAIIP